MPTFCLLPAAVTKFKQGLRDGTIDPYKLNKLTSEERRTFFAKFVGDDQAKEVNALFESKILLKNQKYAYTAWAKKVAGITPEVRRDMLARIERLENILDPQEERQFLNDLASVRLGFAVTEREAKTIADLSRTIRDRAAKADSLGRFKTEDARLGYGMAKVHMENYVNGLKVKDNKIRLSQHPLKVAKDVIGATPGVLKSLVASLDDSFFGRQGIKTLLDVRTSHLWAKNFAKSFVDIGRELGRGVGGIGRKGDAMDLIKADLYSRENALNGKYRAGGYGLDVLSEEAYPSSLPERIPLLGRLFKASETAYNGGALKLRADLADRYIRIAEKQGINTLDRKQAHGIGELIGGMTGRSNLGKAEPLARDLNVLLFSVKFLRANFNTLTLHLGNKNATAFTRKEAAKNLAGIVTSMAGILTIASLLDPDSVDRDPRSSHFGKVKVGGHWVDISGGMSSMATLAARFTPTLHNGKWGFWQKTNSGGYVDLTAGEYGQQNVMDLVNNFVEGKASPTVGILRDIWQGKNYNNEKPTPGAEAKGATIPISIQTYQQLHDSSNADKLKLMVADGLGLSVSTPPKDNWNYNGTKAQQAFKAKVGIITFKKANAEYNDAVEKWSAANTGTINDLPEAERASDITAAKAQIEAKIMAKYGFSYKAAKPDAAKADRKKKVLETVH
jgi:hypothetical protein